jgi:hypothetical protein
MVVVTAGIIERDGKLLIAQRKKGSCARNQGNRHLVGEISTIFAYPASETGLLVNLSPLGFADDEVPALRASSPRSSLLPFPD